MRRYDVLAIAPVDDELPLHVMICHESDDRDDVTLATGLRVAHMGPPLGDKRGMNSHVVGTAGLSDGQQRLIENYISERYDEAKVTLQGSR